MTYEELIARLPDELQTEINAATTAAARSAFGTYHARKRQELRDLELEHERALDEWIREETVRDDALQVPQAQGTAPPTRRKMVLAVLPDFRDQDFIRRDVEAKIIERWPETEPKTDKEAKNFTSGIASTLADLVKKGQLEIREGESPFDPRVYRGKDI